MVVGLDELLRLCAERGLFVCRTYSGNIGLPAVKVRARGNNRKLMNLPAGVRVTPSGTAYSILEAADE